MQIKDSLCTSRITIRDYREADRQFLTGMWFDGENGKYLSDPEEEYVDDKYVKALDALEDNQYGYYLTVVLNGSEEIIGSCCIFPDNERAAFDIGYCIHKNYWKQGYGTEVISLLKKWVRANGGKEITAEVAKDNAASNALLRKNGFEVAREGKFKKYNMDIHFDSYFYRLALKEFSEE